MFNFLKKIRMKKVLRQIKLELFMTIISTFLLAVSCYAEGLPLSPYIAKQIGSWPVQTVLSGIIVFNTWLIYKLLQKMDKINESKDRQQDRFLEVQKELGDKLLEAQEKHHERFLESQKEHREVLKELNSNIHTALKLK